jgi:hypothetical protein
MDPLLINKQNWTPADAEAFVESLKSMVFDMDPEAAPANLYQPGDYVRTDGGPWLRVFRVREIALDVGRHYLIYAASRAMDPQVITDRQVIEHKRTIADINS